MKAITRSLLALTLLVFTTITFAAEIVNINKADAAAIQQNLTGIGPVKAEAIVRYRSKVGKFKNLDDLQNVTGVGPALIKKNKKLLSLSKGVTKGDAKAYSSAKKKASASRSTTSKTTAKKATTTSKSRSTNSTGTTSKPDNAGKSKSKKAKTAKANKSKDKKSKTTKSTSKSKPKNNKKKKKISDT
jgi:competence protein ComEA